ncbi:asparaginase [Alkalihalobacillus sp. AL-G]|uniref:asparaginase n=1 Tax=Alkalihalobacillus sp. AL-G TaxID=2926399 RepID=UPI00272A8428|nr:asparaginase [Alkalihalobacillus sp. AL-G]WLD94535.1 asparaginase [Alkalihalobacillus sp. AL-G]
MNKAVQVFRGELLESTHDAHVAVVNSRGELLYSYGDPDRLTFARSSMKPFQAVPLIETGAAEAFKYEPADISLSCASHSGEDFHRSRVLTILNRIGQKEEALQCGTHIPRDIESYNALIREGMELTPVFSNCSGKHSGMLATAVKMDEEVATYREIEHPVQQRILEVISDVCDYPKEKIGISVDGCGVPVHRLPLSKVAFGFARLATPEVVLYQARSQALQTIRNSMLSHPEMVGGTDRFDSDLMRVFNGRLVAKAGAEAVQCIGDVETGIGIAIKIEDGNGRSVSAVAMEVLKQLGIGNEVLYRQIDDYVQPPVLNMRKDKIGVIKANFELKQPVV